MDGSTNHTYYFETGHSQLSQPSQVSVRNFWQRVAEFENYTGKRLEEGYSHEEWVALFEYFNITHLSTFYTTKSRLMAHLRRLADRNLTDPVFVTYMRDVTYSEIHPDLVYDVQYFPDFESLQAAIECTLYAANRRDDSVYAMHISALYLAWCGLSAEEVIALKKEDVQADHVVVNGRKLYPGRKIMDYLIAYRDAVSFEQQGKGVILRKYVPSDYLLRTSALDHVASAKNLRTFLRVFGKSGGGENVYNFNKVYWSGIFHRVFAYECHHGPIHSGDAAVLETLFQETYDDTGKSYKRLADYQKFRDHFYQNPGVSCGVK